MQIALTNYANSSYNTQYQTQQDSIQTKESIDQTQDLFNEKTDTTEQQEQENKTLDSKAEEILDSLLKGNTQSQKYAIKAMLEQTLNPEEKMLVEGELLRKLDAFIANKEQGIIVSGSSLFQIASSLKTLYESDFSPLDLTA